MQDDDYEAFLEENADLSPAEIDVWLSEVVERLLGKDKEQNNEQG